VEFFLKEIELLVLFFTFDDVEDVDKAFIIGDEGLFVEF
jgi:hypothetical protein